MTAVQPPTSQPPAPPRPPAWAEYLTSLFQSAATNLYILHGNVRDYPRKRELLDEYLRKMAVNTARPVLAYYDRSSGWSFPLPSHRKAARKLVGQPLPGDDDKGEAGGSTRPSANDPRTAMQAAIRQATQGGGPRPGGGEQEDCFDQARRPAQALPLIEKLLTSKDGRGKVAVIINYAESIFPNAPTAQLSPDDRDNLVWALCVGLSRELRDSANPLYLVTDSLESLSSRLREANSGYRPVELPLPDAAARQSFIEMVLQEGQAQGRYNFRWLDVDTGYLARATAGLSNYQIENMMLLADAEGEMTARLVKREKDAIIRAEYEDVVELREPRWGWDAVGGLEHVVTYLKKVVRAYKAGNTARLPKGLLFTGAAGTGKTFVAEAFAKELGTNFIILNPAKLYAGLVGATERNLAKALSLIKSMGGIVFIDEVDQAMRRGEGSSGDSGVSDRVFKAIIEFMSDPDHRGNIIWVFATNRPDLLDAAFRTGRIDKRIPFTPPGDTERSEVLTKLALKAELLPQGGKLRGDTLQAVVAATRGQTIAELEGLVLKASELAYDDSLGGDAAIVAALTRVRPVTKNVAQWTRLAVQDADDLDLVPEAYRYLLPMVEVAEAEPERGDEDAESPVVVTANRPR